MIKMIGILKYRHETFTFGIAPISYNWNCNNQGTLEIQNPQSSSTNFETTGATNSNTMVSKQIRNNEENNYKSIFYTHFNTSTIYALALKQGEAMISLELAIEYPDIYRNDKNWFTTTILMRVTDKLMVQIPEFINKPDKDTHLFLMPPKTYSKIITNKQTTLSLGISLESQFRPE